jgi:tetratricopeptide (TPR) repeat protein
MGNPSEAEAVYREDLKLNPGNPRSLYGLAMALRTQGKLEEAATTEKQFSNAWRYADAQTPLLGQLQLHPTRYFPDAKPRESSITSSQPCAGRHESGQVLRGALYVADYLSGRPVSTVI